MTPKRPNIILIVLDTVGAKHLSLYGSPRRTSPNLERIAEECTVYNRCFAPGCWTIPSHASMFTGLYPSQHGAHEGNLTLNENYQHLVSALKMTGYQTFGISSNGLVSPASGLCRDFDYFKDYGGNFYYFMKRMGLFSKSTAATSGLKTNTKILRNKVKKLLTKVRNSGPVGEELWKIAKGLRLSPRLLRRKPTTNSMPFTENTVDSFRKIIESRVSETNKPFFIFINLMEAHDLYRPPLRFRKYSRWYDKQFLDPGDMYRLKYPSSRNGLIKKYMNLYDDELCYLDDAINRIWQYFKQTPIFDDTVFIITSDHGEHFGEKGLYYHFSSLYNELIWVPLMVRFPPSVKKAGTDHRLVSLNDLYSTILDLAENPFPRPETSLSVLSSSLREYALSQVITSLNSKALKLIEDSMRNQGLSFSMPTMAMISDSGRKVIERVDGSLEVYNLNQDMAETQDLVSEIPLLGLENYRTMLEFLKIETGFPQEAAKQSKITPESLQSV